MNHKSITSYGTSLLECCIVLALIACITGIAFAQLKLFNTLSLRNEMHTLCATAHYLQQRALTTRMPQILTFDIEQQQYRYNDTVHQLPSSIRFGFITGSLGPPSVPHMPITYPCSFKNNQLIFFSDGIISSGTLYLVNDTQTVAYALSSAVGSVSCLRVYTYSNGTWKKQHD